MKYKASDIGNCLRRFVNAGNDIVLTNYFVGLYEMDVFRLTGSNYLYEYEIKISKADFYKDFQKGNKHNNICDRCNCFFFVVPEGLVPLSEIPKEYGVIYFRQWEEKPWRYDFTLIRNAKKLNKKPQSDIIWKELARKLFFINGNLRHKILSERLNKEQLRFESSIVKR